VSISPSERSPTLENTAQPLLFADRLWTRSNVPLLAGIAAVSIGVALRYVKAYRAPITYDEAFSLLHFASLPWAQIFRDYHLPNNHILNTLLIKAVSYISIRELALRLHSVVGSSLLLWACLALSRRASGLAAGICTCLWVATLPILVAFGALARGYGLGLGLLFSGIAWTLARIERAERPAPLWPCALPLGLAMSCVPTFAHAVAAFFGALSVSVWLGQIPAWSRARLRSTLELFGVLFLPTGAIAALTYAWITRWPNEGFVWGHDRFDEALAALLGNIVQISLEPGVAFWIGLALWLVVLAWTVTAALRRAYAPFVLGLMSCTIPLLFIAVHLARDVKYPLDRTWLYMLPLAAIGIHGALAQLTERIGARRSATVLTALTTITVAYNLIKLDFRATPPWEHNVEVKPAMKQLSRVTRTAELCVSWYNDAPFEYYARRYKIGLHLDCGSQRDFIFSSPADRAQYPAPKPGAVVYQSADGQYVLYKVERKPHKAKKRER
jgi:hypothetical protein